jgi:hypothetical protein
MSQADKPAVAGNEPFLATSDRPEVKPDARVADLTVRDLLNVFRSNGVLKANQTEYKLKDWTEYLKTQLSKYEIFGKSENFKIEKAEHWEVYTPAIPGGADPRFADIAQGIAGLSAQVHKLASEVAELRKGAHGSDAT